MSEPVKTNDAYQTDTDDGGNGNGNGNGNGGNQPPVIDWDNIDPKVLDALNKRQAARDKRNKVIDDINKERERTSTAITEAQADYSRWQQNNPLDQQKRTALENKITAAEQQVKDAKDAVDAQKSAVTKAEQAVKGAEQAVANEETKYGDAQKELGQFVAKIKENQTKIDRLRGEVLSAIDVNDWPRAYYKNYRLKEALAADADLRVPEKRQQSLLAQINGLEDQVVNGKIVKGAITVAKDQVAAKKADLDKQKSLLKAAEDELKQKQTGLETAIENFL